LLNREPEWQEAEKEIRKQRDSFEKVSDSTAKALAKAMPHEIDYVYASWRGRHEEALSIANKILEALEGGSDLKPYRAFWYHQTATSAFLAWKHSGNEAFKATTISYLEKAAASSSHITWLEKLRFHVSGQSGKVVEEALPLQDWFLEINGLLEEWGISGGKFAKKLAEVQSNIESKAFNTFESGLASLGKMLGAKIHQWTQDGAPDGLWIFGEWCAFVFEAKTNEKPDKGISLDTVTQAGRHEVRVRADKLIPTFVPCFTVVISPRSTIDTLTKPHLKDITYISHDNVISLFTDTASALERVRQSASGNAEETLQANALQFYKDKGVALQNVKNLLMKKKLKDLPIQ
jgi:hypothetical protein